MQILSNLITALLPLSYGLAAVNYQVYFARRDPFAGRTCTPLLIATVVLHGAYLLLRVLYFERHPLVGIAETLSVIAIAVAGVYLYVERVQGNKFTGAFIIPMVVFLQLASSAMLSDQPQTLSSLLENSLFSLHVIVAVLGYTAFAVGAVYGIMYLALYRALKRQRFGLMFDRLPSLDVLASMGFWAGFLGWIALTITILLGVIMSIELVPGFYRDAKFITTVLVWTVYGAMALAHFALGWRGARSAYLSLTGFGFAMIAMIGSNYLWPTFHTFQT